MGSAMAQCCSYYGVWFVLHCMVRTARTVHNTGYGGVHNRGSDLYTYIMDVRLGPNGAVQSMKVSATGSVR